MQEKVIDQIGIAPDSAEHIALLGKVLQHLIANIFKYKYIFYNQ